MSLETYLIVCPLVFLAGLIDAIGGGGGLISLPAYMIAGLPPHACIATNKMSSTFGTALATLRFMGAGLINFNLAIPSLIAAIIGSTAGANISLIIPEKAMTYVLFVVLPVSAFLVLNKNKTNKMLYFARFAPLFIARPAPIYPPTIFDAAAAIPRGNITCPLIRNMAKAVTLVVRLITFVCALAVFMSSFANTVNAIIKKVPVPGP